MSIFGGPDRGGGGAPVRDLFGNAVSLRGQRPDTSYSRSYGGGVMNSYVQAPVMQPGGNQLLFPAITTAPLVQTQTIDMNGQPQTRSVIVPSTQSLIPPPSTLLTSSFAGLAGTGASLMPGNMMGMVSGNAFGVSPSPMHRSEFLRGNGSSIIGIGDEYR